MTIVADGPAAGDTRAAPEPALAVTGLSVRYAVGSRALRALDDVSLDVPAGQRIAIVGESGSGKSTLGLAVMGLLPRNAASSWSALRLAGAPLDAHDERAMRAARGRTMSMVFQDAKASLDPVRTIGSQVAEVLRVHRIVGRREVGDEVVRLLAAVEIRRPELVARQYPHELSGGMRQRAMIATALAGRPKLLIADEPTSALDVTTQASVVDLLSRLGESSEMSTMLITHDLALVARFADRVAVLYAGRLLEEGPVERIYRAPAHPYTKALLDSVPSIDDARAKVLASIPGSLPDLTDAVAGCVFEPRCPIGNGRDECRTVHPPHRPVPGGGVTACHFSDAVSGLGAIYAEGDEAAATPVAVTPAHRAGGHADGGVTMQSIVKTFKRRGHVGPRARTVAVGGVDLEIAQGQSVGIVGESGSGKTTLARILIGLETADSGVLSVREAGRPATVVPRLPRDYAQFVFQDPGDSLNPLMSVGELISEPLVLRDGGRARRYRERVAELLHDVGLRATMIDRRPSELSGGQRQRVAIARALATEPRLIIADEAVASLDMSARGQILNLLARLQDEHGFAYLYISHDLSMVRHVCDRVVVMYSGRVVEVADTDDLFASPRHPYTQALIAAVPVPDPTAERRRERVLMTGAAAEPDAEPDTSRGCAFRHRCPIAQERCAAETPLIDEHATHGAACHFAGAS